jgi:hypothetical protein
MVGLVVKLRFLIISILIAPVVLLSVALVVIGLAIIVSVFRLWGLKIILFLWIMVRLVVIRV